MIQFKELTTISKKDSITDKDLDIAVQLLKKLEKDKCSDYIGKKNGNEYVISGRTYLFGQICLKTNSQSAVKEYINYLKREHGSAEEELGYLFEKIFIQQPEYVLLMTENNENLLNQLAWGFLNNHYGQLTAKNYKKMFFEINPKVKRIYPKYKKSVDYLLHEIYEEIKNPN